MGTTSTRSRNCNCTAMSCITHKRATWWWWTRAADMTAGVFGEMMLTYFMGRGGLGVVIDGCIRDFPEAKKLGIGLWMRGTTPNFHTQTGIFPYAVNVPIACNNVLVIPGDIIVADDDGVVVVPVKMAEALLAKSSTHHEWEEFSRIRLSEGGDLRTYYPLVGCSPA